MRGRESKIRFYILISHIWNLWYLIGGLTSKSSWSRTLEAKQRRCLRRSSYRFSRHSSFADIDLRWFVNKPFEQTHAMCILPWDLDRRITGNESGVIASIVISARYESARARESPASKAAQSRNSARRWGTRRAAHAFWNGCTEGGYLGRRSLPLRNVQVVKYIEIRGTCWRT